MCAGIASLQKVFLYNPMHTTSLAIRFAMIPCGKDEPTTGIVGTRDSSMRAGIHTAINSGRSGQSATHSCIQPCSRHCLANDPSNSKESKTSSRVPIPVRKDRRESVTNHEETNDLSRMYDCATWKMYERIVTARRQQLQSHDGYQKLRINNCNNTSSSHANFPLHTSDLQKASSSDSVTVDDSDKSSMFSLASSLSTSSSLSASFLFGATIKNVPSECSQEEQQQVLVPERENEELFIFELDL
eukprot:CCRYP_013910-RB/>CCRYP_013910-RB protein AED:0.11 eAED:0.17 QI:2357/1/0.66/1/1/0.66/3/0/243